MKVNKNLIAYCGLYCGQCPFYEGKIADLAKDLRKELRHTKFDRIAKGLSKYFRQFNNYDACYEFLGTMVKFRCKKTCYDGGGPPFCRIRKCCLKRGSEGCWECAEFEVCKKLDFLSAVHKDGHIKNLRKIRKQSIKRFLQGKKYW